MDIFFLQIVLIFIPGIIWERIDNRFGVNRPCEQFDVLRRAFCFGLSSYLVVFLVVVAVNGLGHLLSPDHQRLIRLHMITFAKDKYTLSSSDVGEIVGASATSLVSAILWLYITNNKLPVWFMQKINATRRFGDEDVWDFTFNSRRAEVEYVHVRDFENQLTYSGWVELFSETGSTRELVLRDVEVSRLDGSTTYSTPRLYLARPIDSVTIEFPYIAKEELERDRDEQDTEASRSAPSNGRVRENAASDGGLLNQGRTESAGISNPEAAIAADTDTATGVSVDRKTK